MSYTSDASKIILNGYPAFYMPNHPRAYNGCGCVYEHILVAEEKLGRPLNPGECVHHIDENKKNNSPSNLMVFKTNSDHAKYHTGCEAILLDDGTYVCNSDIIYIDKKPYRICPICKKQYMSPKSNMCFSCALELRQEQRKMNVNRERLKELIFNYPFTKVGEMFGVTDNAIRKWCKKYNLPTRKTDILKYSADEWCDV